MKFFTGCLAAVAMLAASSALAQVPVRGGLIAVSDLEGPYGPAEAVPAPRYGYEYEERGPAPVLLPATEVYAVLRDNGFSPLGIPRLRGALYTIAVIDRRGDDGRLVIDARDGRILRFMTAADAYGMAPANEDMPAAPYGPQAALPLPTLVRGGPPRPPAPIPHVARRSVPLPRVAPSRGEATVAAAKPTEPSTPQAQPAQQTAAVQAKAAEGGASTVGQARPASAILPTQAMPPAQGLD